MNVDRDFNARFRHVDNGDNGETNGLCAAPRRSMHSARFSCRLCRARDRARFRPGKLAYFAFVLASRAAIIITSGGRYIKSKREFPGEARSFARSGAFVTRSIRVENCSRGSETHRCDAMGEREGERERERERERQRDRERERERVPLLGDHRVATRFPFSVGAQRQLAPD